MATLERILATFVDTYRHGAPALLSGQGAEAIHRKREMCHSLKGACATVGASALQRQFHALESELREGADTSAIAHHANQLQEQLVVLVGRLSDALEGH